MSQEGFDNLKNQIERLKTVDRPNISKQIGEARDKGDLSENAEYDAAKEAQGLLELKISKLEESLGNSRVIDPSTLDLSKVGILSKVRVLNKKVNKEIDKIHKQDSKRFERDEKLFNKSRKLKEQLGID